MNLGAILKMLGVKLPPDKLAAIEAFLPQIPAKGQQVVDTVNFAVKNFDDRLIAIEKNQQRLERLQMALLVRLVTEDEKIEEMFNGTRGVGDGSGPCAANR